MLGPWLSLSFLLKVSKSQKQILLFSFEPKNEWNYFLISALASNEAMKLQWRHFIWYINEGVLNRIKDFIFLFDLFWIHRAEIKIISFVFWFKLTQQNLLLKLTDLYRHLAFGILIHGNFEPIDDSYML